MLEYCRLCFYIVVTEERLTLRVLSATKKRKLPGLTPYIEVVIFILSWSRHVP